MTGARGAIRFTGRRHLRPPRIELRFEVTLRGAQSERRWVVLPTLLRPGQAQPQRRTAHTVEAYELPGTNRMVVCVLRSEDGLAALLLPAGAELTLDGFPIAFWGPPPAEAEIEILSAAALLIDGEPLEDRMALDLLCDREAVADASPLEDQRTVVESLGGGLTTRMMVELVDPSTTSHGVALGDA